MNIDVYKKEVKRHDRATALGFAASTCVIFASLGIAGFVRHLNDGLADIVAPIIIFMIGTPLMLYGFYRLDRLYRRFPSLICPHCKGTLAKARSVIVATGNCPHCGRQVLTDNTIGT